MQSADDYYKLLRVAPTRRCGGHCALIPRDFDAVLAAASSIEHCSSQLGEAAASDSAFAALCEDARGLCERLRTRQATPLYQLGLVRVLAPHLVPTALAARGAEHTCLRLRQLILLAGQTNPLSHHTLSTLSSCDALCIELGAEQPDASAALRRALRGYSAEQRRAVADGVRRAMQISGCVLAALAAVELLQPVLVLLYPAYRILRISLRMPGDARAARSQAHASVELGETGLLVCACAVYVRGLRRGPVSFYAACCALAVGSALAVSALLPSEAFVEERVAQLWAVLHPLYRLVDAAQAAHRWLLSWVQAVFDLFQPTRRRPPTSSAPGGARGASANASSAMATLAGTDGRTGGAVPADAAKRAANGSSDEDDDEDDEADDEG